MMKKSVEICNTIGRSFVILLAMCSLIYCSENVARRSVDDSTPIESNSYELIWIDDCILERSDDCRQTQSLLQELSPSVRFFWDYNDVIRSMRSEMHTEKMFLIVISGKKASLFLRYLTLYKLNGHVKGVFIYCNKPNDYLDLQHDKLVGVYTDRKVLIQAIRHVALISSSNRTLESQNNLFNWEQTWFRSVSMTTLSDIWRDLLLEVLIMLPRDEQAKQDMIKQSKEYYAENTKELYNIEVFDEGYNSKLAINWYTEDNFVHKLVNQALRTKNIYILYAFRLFIGDLSASIKQWQRTLSTISRTIVSKVKDGFASTIKLFSGQQIRQHELNHLKENIGTIISINSFLSTSTLRSTARRFMNRKPIHPDMQSVMIEITFNSSQKDISTFMDVTTQSAYEDEEEILFDFNSKFKVTDVRYDRDEELWIIKMITIGNESINVHPYMNTLREMFIVNHSLPTTLGIIMAHGFEQKEQAMEYFNQMVLTLPDDHADLPDILQQRAILYQEKGDNTLALKDYERALEIRRQRIENNILGTISLNSHIGNLHLVTSDSQTSLNSHQTAMHTYEQLYGTEIDHITKAKLNENIGLTYYQNGNTSKALEYLENAQVIYKKLLPAKHLFHIELLGHIGDIHESTGNFILAEKFFRRQLNWSETILPSDHPLIINYLEAIFRISMKMNKTSNLSQLFNTHMQKLKKIFRPQNTVIARFLFMIASWIEEFEPAKALEYYEEAITVIRNSTQPDLLLMLKCHKNLVEIYKNMGNMTKALDHALKSLSLYPQFVFKEKNESNEADTLYNIGLIYMNMASPMQAFTYLTKALSIYKSIYTTDHPKIQAVLDHIIKAANNIQSATSLQYSQSICMKKSQLFDTFKNDH